MQTFNDYVSIATEAIAAIKYPATPAGLYDPIAYTMSLGGKRLRPILTLMTCEAFGGQYESAIYPAMGVELYHNFTLLHDDVMDKADIRRGKPTVHCKWNDNVAILSGDTMLTIATQYIAKAAALHLKKAIDLFNSTAIEVYEGQQYDMDFENDNNITIDEYINMIRLKTSVLIGCACKMGAILGNASDADADAIYQYGLNLGLAFQLQDDLLDVYGDEATFGKAIGGDIMNNKKTFMLINAINKATGTDKAELMDWIANPSPDRAVKVKAVTDLYTRLGIRELAEDAIGQYNKMALDTLDSITSLSAEARQSFIDFANMLIHRQK